MSQNVLSLSNLEAVAFTKQSRLLSSWKHTLIQKTTGPSGEFMTLNQTAIPCENIFSMANPQDWAHHYLGSDTRYLRGNTDSKHRRQVIHTCMFNKKALEKWRETDFEKKTSLLRIHLPFFGRNTALKKAIYIIPKGTTIIQNCFMIVNYYFDIEAFSGLSGK